MPQKELDNDFVIDDDQELQYVRQLGSGGYGSVHELFYIPKKRSLARKVVHLPSRDKAYVEREVHAIQRLCVGPETHRNIVQVMNHGLLWNSPYYYIDMELCDLNLEDYIQEKTPSNTVGSLPCFIKGGGLDALIQTWTIMSQIASGVEYIHSEHQIHRDIKPGNVLYSSKDHLWKLADFGLSVEGSSKTNRLTTSSKGTPGYRSPELLEFEGEPSQHTNRVDIWAMGCILYQLVTGTQLFKSDWAVIYHVYDAKSVDVSLDNTFDADSTQIITKYIVDMLQVKPAERPSAATLSMKFNRHLLLARQRARLSDVLTVAETKEPIPETSTASQKPRVVAASVDLPVTTQTVPMTTPLREQDNLAPKSSKIHGQTLPPRLIGLWLHDEAGKGNLETVKALINAGADVNAQGRFFGYALEAAAWNGHKAVVEFLLENGADVNAQGGEYGNALQAAAYKAFQGVVELLLEKGADVNAQGGYAGNALQAASTSGNVAVVRLLLEKGADVNAQGGQYRTALQAASTLGSEAVARLLLEEGADVNAQVGGEYGNALQAASSHGREAVVRLLLEKGANVNAQGGENGYNALEAASRFGHEAVVRLLLEKGADVNPQALQAASSNAHEAVVRLLREKDPRSWRNRMANLLKPGGARTSTS